MLVSLVDSGLPSTVLLGLHQCTEQTACYSAINAKWLLLCLQRSTWGSGFDFTVINWWGIDSLHVIKAHRTIREASILQGFCMVWSICYLLLFPPLSPLLLPPSFMINSIPFCDYFLPIILKGSLSANYLIFFIPFQSSFVVRVTNPLGLAWKN